MNQRTKLRRALTACALLACLIVGAPSAYASFTSATAASMTASTHVLAVPAGNIVSADCSPIGNSGKHRLGITVTHYGTVARANIYILRVTDPYGLVRTVSLVPGYTFQDDTAVGGWWTYSIDAQYRVPGSTNTWTSKASQVSVYC